MSVHAAQVPLQCSTRGPQSAFMCTPRAMLYSPPVTQCFSSAPGTSQSFRMWPVGLQGHLVPFSASQSSTRTFRCTSGPSISLWQHPRDIAVPFGHFQGEINGGVWGECVWPGTPHGCRCHPAHREGGFHLLPQSLYPPKATSHHGPGDTLAQGQPPPSPRASPATERVGKPQFPPAPDASQDAPRGHPVPSVPILQAGAGEAGLKQTMASRHEELKGTRFILNRVDV